MVDTLTKLLPNSPNSSLEFRPKRKRRSKYFVRSVPLVPSLILMGFFMLVPIVLPFYRSFADSSLTGSSAAKASFIGLKNYRDLASTPTFANAIILTIAFVFFSAIAGQNVMGMCFALLIRSASRRLRSIVGTIVVISWVLLEVVEGFAIYAFARRDGTFNEILNFLGLNGPDWKYSFLTLVVILANVWRGTAFSMLSYSAALSPIPTEMVEAAAVDGASGLRRFKTVVIPMIRRNIATTSMLIILQTLSVFTLIYTITGGGPNDSSTTLPILAYQQAFAFGAIRYGTAIGTIVLLVRGFFSIINIKELGKDGD